jgi:uncharacterized protein (TIGR02145 family)
MSTNNSSGFSALPGGYRYNDDFFNYQGDYGYWWSATASGAAWANYRNLYYFGSDLSGDSLNNEYGFSVRLLRD